MLVKTKHFGEVDLDESKIIHFPEGILGFENLKDYTLLYDNEDGDAPFITWLQSVDEGGFAIPVLSPFLVKEGYNPEIEDELLKEIGTLTEENIVVLVSLTVPEDVKDMSVNLKAPFIINADTKKAVQVIVEGDDFEIKYPIYEKIKKVKSAKGDK